jgi:hypothetical protein
MVLYRILLGIDVLAAGVVLFFFAWGLQDGSVSSFNALLWAVLLLLALGVPASAILLKRSGRVGLASALLALPAVPATLLGLLVLLLAVAGGHWH